MDKVLNIRYMGTVNDGISMKDDVQEGDMYHDVHEGCQYVWTGLEWMKVSSSYEEPQAVSGTITLMGYNEMEDQEYISHEDSFIEVQEDSKESFMEEEWPKDMRGAVLKQLQAAIGDLVHENGEYKVAWTAEASEQLKTLHNIDIEEELAKILMEEISAEIARMEKENEEQDIAIIDLGAPLDDALKRLLNIKLPEIEVPQELEMFTSKSLVNELDELRKDFEVYDSLKDPTEDHFKDAYNQLMANWKPPANHEAGVITDIRRMELPMDADMYYAPYLPSLAENFDGDVQLVTLKNPEIKPLDLESVLKKEFIENTASKLQPINLLAALKH